MDLIWYGGTCVRLQSGAASILADPFDLPLSSPLLSADVVTLSRREARDRLLAREPYRLVEGPGEYEIKGVPITGIATPVDGADGTGGSVALEVPGQTVPAGAAPRRKNMIYTMTLDGIVVSHLGRLSRPPAALAVEELGSPDIVLIPLGEPQGLPVAQAVALASQLEARLVIPLRLSHPGEQVRRRAWPSCRARFRPRRGSCCWHRSCRHSVGQGVPDVT
jgi:L-ascorbate metabolism protein UlaG (beta-lactamase superfamily)